MTMTIQVKDMQYLIVCYSILNWVSIEFNAALTESTETGNLFAPIF